MVGVGRELCGSSSPTLLPNTKEVLLEDDEQGTYRKRLKVSFTK